MQYPNAHGSDYIGKSQLPDKIEGLRVLIVDDSIDLRALLQEILEFHGVKVISAATAARALEMLNQNDIDAVISDIAMPIEDGFSFLRKIRALPNLTKSQVPVVALSAFARKEEREFALKVGFQAHVSKPFDAKDLIYVLSVIVK